VSLQSSFQPSLYEAHYWWNILTNHYNVFKSHQKSPSKALISSSTVKAIGKLTLLRSSYESSADMGGSKPTRLNVFTCENTSREHQQKAMLRWRAPIPFQQPQLLPTNGNKDNRSLAIAVTPQPIPKGFLGCPIQTSRRFIKDEYFWVANND